jgi:hypothetical protein
MNAVTFNHPQSGGDIYFYAVLASNYFEELLMGSQHKLKVPLPLAFAKGTMWHVNLGWKRAEVGEDILA